MKPQKGSISTELGTELDRFGTERGGRVACIVVVTFGEIQFCWPGAMDTETIEMVERWLLEALLAELGERPWNGPKSR